MSCPIPGYSSISQFAREHNLPYMTAKNHIIRGICSWPRRKMDGKTKNIAYKCWENMIQRCLNPNMKGYHNYGGRGVRVYGQWLISFDNFIQYIGERPSLKHSIDRIDSEGNYEPGNVRWATPQEQADNKRGRKGCIYWDKARSRWHVQRKEKHIGRYKTREEAEKVLQQVLDNEK